MITERDVIEQYSPALCELIYRTHQRQLLREKLIDISVVNAGFAGGEHASTLSREIQAALRGEPNGG